MITAVGGRLAVRLPAARAESPANAGESSAGPDRILTDAELRKLEADNIRAALKAADGKIYGPGGAAELLGVKPTTLASRMKALGLIRSVGDAPA